MENLILNKVKKWFIDRDLENGGRLDKQSLKLSEEFGELCAGFLKKNEALTKDSIGDCAVVVVGLALLIEEDVQNIFEEANNIRRKEAMDCFKLLNANISEFQLSQDLASKKMCRHNLVRIVAYLKSISNILGYEFLECFTGAYNEIKDRKGRWIDGSFVKEEDLKNELARVGEAQKNQIRAWIKEEKCFADYIESIRYYSKEIDLCWGGICESDCFGFEDVIFTQSTGLKDKDGKEIFEGDVLGIETETSIIYVNVFWDSEYALFMFESKEYNEKEALAGLLEDISYPFYVVGNIYENPELFEVE